MTPERILRIGTGVFLVLCLLGGGASRMSDAPLVLIRPLAVLLIGASLALAGPDALRPYRSLLLLLGMFAGTMAIQLLPLPPSIWARLPLSGLYGPALASAGLDGSWRPLSIAPDLTMNSLLSLLPPLAAVLALATWTPRQRGALLTWLLLCMAASAVLGLAQFAGGNSSPLYFWMTRSEGVADGVFANRNHHAVFLACGLALIGTWITASVDVEASHRGLEPFARRGTAGRERVVTRLATGAALALLFLATVIATGSRTGALLAIVATGYSYWCVARSPALARASLPQTVRWSVRWGWVAVPLLLGVMALASRAVTFDRLMATDASADQRVRSMPVMLDMLARLFPYGSGYGTFDPVFRTFEPARLLHWGNFNHAHNDILELALVGGLPAVLAMIAAAVWLGTGAIRLLAAPSSQAVVRARSAMVAMILLLAASLVDYPVRTPLLACLLMILCVWTVDGRSRSATPGSDFDATRA